MRSGITDPTAGDLPSNTERHEVVANILGSPHPEGAQKTLINSVEDAHKEHG